jgi:hypothetical protein
MQGQDTHTELFDVEELSSALSIPPQETQRRVSRHEHCLFSLELHAQLA